LKLEGVVIPNQSSSGEWRERWLMGILSGLALVLLWAKVLFSLNIIWQIFNFAFQVDESEGMIVAETLLMDQGINIYAPLHADRFIAAPYTPLYYLLNWPFLHFIGASFKPGRFISFLAFCGISFLLYKLIASYTASKSVSSSTPSIKPDRIAGLAAALFWVSLGLSAFWGGAVKPDMLALFFSLAGVYAIFRYSQKINLLEAAPLGDLKSVLLSDKWLYIGAFYFALAAMTKQTAFAGPLACLVFLVLCCSFWSALRFGVVWAVLAFGPMLLMNWLSNNGFWYHIVTVHELPWSLENYWKFFSGFVKSYQLYVGLSLIFLVLWLLDLLKTTWSLRRPLAALQSNRATLFILYLGTSWGTGLSAGTYGGNHNHLLELAAAICLASGLMVSRLRQWWQGSSKLKYTYPLLLLLVSLQTTGLFVGEGRVKPEDFPVLGSTAPTQAGLEVLRSLFYNPESPWLGLEYRTPPPGLKEGLGQVAAFMTNDVGQLIYTDNVSLALASQKPILTTDPFTQTHATYFKRWDESYLIELIERKQFHLIVLRARIEERLQTTGAAQDIYLSPGLAQAILANYNLTQSNAAFIYEPKN